MDWWREQVEDAVRGVGEKRHRMALQQDDDIIRVALSRALPCGMPGCGKPATWALVEHDPTTPGLWQLLPMCDGCLRIAREANRHRSPREHRVGAQ